MVLPVTASLLLAYLQETNPGLWEKGLIVFEGQTFSFESGPVVTGPCIIIDATRSEDATSTGRTSGVKVETIPIPEVPQAWIDKWYGSSTAVS